MVGTGVEGEYEVESDVSPLQASSEWRSMNNQDRDSTREGLTRSHKRSLPPSGESSSKLRALSPIHGKVAPLRPKKILTTLGVRTDNPSGGDADAAKPKSSEPGPTKTSAGIVS